MNRKGEKHQTGEGEASSASSAALPSLEFPHSSSSGIPSENDTMKRAAAKKLIERYFYQLIDGCGNSNCDNEHCASSGKVKNLTPNQAAAQAIQLFSQEARLCDMQPSKVARTQSGSIRKNNEYGRSTSDSNNTSKEAAAYTRSQSATPRMEGDSPSVPQGKPVGYLTEEKLVNILETCQKSGSWVLLIRALGEVFSRPVSLGQSFLQETPDSPLEAILNKAPKDLKNLKKEDVRTLEGEPDKDEDSQELAESVESGATSRLQYHSTSPDDIGLDFASVRRAYKALLKEAPSSAYEGPLVQAVSTLAQLVEVDLRFPLGVATSEELLRSVLVVLELPTLGSSEYLEQALPALCHALVPMPLPMQARLARILARHCKMRLKTMLEALQQLITLKVISGHFTRDYYVQDEESITAPTKFMKVLYYANMLAGELDPPELRQEEDVSAGSGVAGSADDGLLGAVGLPPSSSGLLGKGSRQQPPPPDPLGAELGISVLDARKPLLPFSEFYNEPLSDAVEMDKDFAYYKSDMRSFSFMNYAFILTPATKTLGLYYDNRIRMYSERRISIFHTVVGQPMNPYLRLKVRRDHIIDDALVELEMVAMENPKDLKKQLVVEFEGEQGIDEGGVSKEFFQLVVEEIFNPDYGMFTLNQETQTVWFNPTSFESDAQFTLIGIVLGLAIYNNVILDVHFPMVVYRKLMGKRGTYWDLEDWNPALFSGLRELLNYEDSDIEDVFMQTFRICYQDVFGTTFFHELKEGGDQIFVNQENKREFVDLYADFLLNTSVEKQFRAFRRGFQMVTDESPLHLLFRPEEVEQLVCGSKNFDFTELEEATEYDGGYTLDSPVIKDFWEIVHKMSVESKRKLLQFATGSDRVPVGGLSKLKLIIARNGPDSDRLPTAHTCFNVLLLPEYENKEKLSDRLMKAINYSKGFGML
ncbi:hypothetical protein R5R35_011808 [Gryllus longicercus]|uniref:Ubiquitin-protein ligase E3A n=1 Tax=Gryllus longicercus TaxID=2509291 RepID=A0AAN9WPN8_9ORTH